VFSPDGKTLVWDSLPRSQEELVLWDVASKQPARIYLHEVAELLFRKKTPMINKNKNI